MSDWMAAADAMIHATAGLTVLEAHIRGCPVVSYGFSAGHLRANNAAFERFGLAEVARSDHELESVLRHVTRERRSPDSSFASLPSIASRALSVRPRVRPQPVWRLRTARVVAAAAVAARAAGAGARRGPAGERPGTRSPSRSRAASTSARTTTPPVVSKAQPAPPAQPAVRTKPRPTPLLDRRGGRGRRSPRPPSPTRARRWRRSCRRSATRSGSCCARTGRRASPSPSTTGRTRRARRRSWRRCARRAPGRPSSSPASRSCGGRRWWPRSSPPATGSSCTATATATSCGSVPAQLLEDADRARAAIEEASGQAIADYRPPYGIFSAVGLRAVRGRGWRPVLWSQWGRDWDRRATPASIARSRHDPRPRRGHPAPARRRLLQRAGLLGPHRRRPADHPRGARGAGAEVDAAAPLSRRRERSTDRSRRRLRRVAAPSCSSAVPGRRSAWPLALRPPGRG